MYLLDHERDCHLVGLWLTCCVSVYSTVINTRYVILLVSSVECVDQQEQLTVQVPDITICNSAEKKGHSSSNRFGTVSSPASTINRTLTISCTRAYPFRHSIIPSFHQAANKGVAAMDVDEDGWPYPGIPLDVEVRVQQCTTINININTE